MIEQPNELNPKDGFHQRSPGYTADTSRIAIAEVSREGNTEGGSQLVAYCTHPTDTDDQSDVARLKAPEYSGTRASLSPVVAASRQGACSLNRRVRLVYPSRW